MSTSSAHRPSVVVAGGGNAALCAAIAAAETGAQVTVFERAPRDLRGGNTAFCGGGMRFAYRSADDLVELMPLLPQEALADAEIAPYTTDDFLADIYRVTERRASPALAELLVHDSYDTLRWMVGHGLQLVPSFTRQSFKLEGKYRFWSGVPLEVAGGGMAIVDTLTAAAVRLGVTMKYDSRVIRLLADGLAVKGAVVRDGDGVEREHLADATILACGGFEANAQWRVAHLGPGWDLAKVRGSHLNTGDGLQMALGHGARPDGHWSGCHAVAWDRSAPDFGDQVVRYGYCKHHYTLGILVNAEGRRFVDEGADIRSYTYAKYGRRVLEQPGQVAWQIFDAKVADLLPAEHYRADHVTTVRADTLEQLVGQIDGIEQRQCMRTIEDFNRAARSPAAFDPTVMDGKATSGVEPPKSNWANPIDTPPFEAFAVTCGITFTFGGVAVSTEGRVLDTDQRVIPGLFACGEMAGGVFYFNYPGGSGLTWGSVLGRAAGRAAGSSNTGL